MSYSNRIFSRRSTLLICVTYVSAGALAGVSSADWPATGVAVTVAPDTQQYHQAVTDGAGGTIVVWEDHRNGTDWDVFAQRIDSGGNPVWTLDGVSLCSATGDQIRPRIATDGSGGAIVVWWDQRSATFDVYAQRVDSSGGTLWATDGVIVCTAPGNQLIPDITSDGAGGAIVVWEDGRNFSHLDIYAQHMNGGGGTTWAANGVAVCLAINYQYTPRVVADGAGGAVVVWHDERFVVSDPNEDIFAQRIDAAGNMLWTADGVAICTAPDDQRYVDIAADGSGGAVVAWEDYRLGFSDVFAQRVNGTGTTVWAPDGVAVSAEPRSRVDYDIEDDGEGGAFVVWQEWRFPDDYDIYAQRIDVNGVRQWSMTGTAVVSLPNGQRNPGVASDDAGGILVTWEDDRSGASSDVYVQRFDSSGGVVWSADGELLCGANQDQSEPVICGMGDGTAIVTWYDERNGTIDLYAGLVQNQTSGADLPETVPDAPRAHLLYGMPNPTSGTAVLGIEVERATPARIDVFDQAGRRVRSIDLGILHSGRSEVVLDVRDRKGDALSSGVYFYSLIAGGDIDTRKLVLTR